MTNVVSMVTLSKIYTRTGDGGQTRLGDMSQVAKTSLRIEAYGCIDELNSVIGLIRLVTTSCADVLIRVQNDLFDLGADLCVPPAPDEQGDDKLRVQPEHVQYLEKQIDRINADLQPLKSFVLPGGSEAAAWLHMGRTICRRAEREVWRLAAEEQVGGAVMEYLNRLSDLLFVMARAANDGGTTDVLWQPGKGVQNSRDEST